MYYTGFADEAANDLATQIKATKELGWSNIESRRIDGCVRRHFFCGQYAVVDAERFHDALELHLGIGLLDVGAHHPPRIGDTFLASRTGGF